MEYITLGIPVFLMGLAVGSFVNVLAFRIPRNEEWVSTPSHCTSCGHRLAWYELVPLLSWLALRGRCRACKSPISWRYPAVELGHALLWLLCAFALGPVPFLPIALLITTCLTGLSLIDWETREIPDGFQLVLLGLGLAWNGYAQITGQGLLAENLIGFLAASLPLLLIAFLTGGGMGGGDIKLMAVCGLLLGWKNILLALALGSVLGSLIMVPRHLLQKRERREEVPFGPFLSAGVYLAMCFGGELIAWYLTLF